MIKKFTQVRCKVRAFNDELIEHECLVFPGGGVQVFDSVLGDWTTKHDLSESDKRKVRAAAKGMK